MNETRAMMVGYETTDSGRKEVGLDELNGLLAEGWEVFALPELHPGAVSLGIVVVHREPSRPVPVSVEADLVRRVIAATGDSNFMISGMPGRHGGLSYFGEWRSRGEEHRIGGESVNDVLRAILATEEKRPAAAP